MLIDVNNFFVFKILLTTPSSVLPLHIKQTFPPIIWIFTEGEGDGIKSRLPFKIFSTLKIILYVTNWRMIFGIQVHVLHWRNFYWNSSINHIKRFFFDLKKNLWMLKNKRNNSYAIGKLYMYYPRRREFKNLVAKEWFDWFQKIICTCRRK